MGPSHMAPLKLWCLLPCPLLYASSLYGSPSMTATFYTCLSGPPSMVPFSVAPTSDEESEWSAAAAAVSRNGLRCFLRFIILFFFLLLSLLLLVPLLFLFLQFPSFLFLFSSCSLLLPLVLAHFFLSLKLLFVLFHLLFFFSRSYSCPCS